MDGKQGKGRRERAAQQQEDRIRVKTFLGRTNGKRRTDLCPEKSLSAGLSTQGLVRKIQRTGKNPLTIRLDRNGSSGHDETMAESLASNATLLMENYD